MIRWLNFWIYPLKNQFNKFNQVDNHKTYNHSQAYIDPIWLVIFIKSTKFVKNSQNDKLQFIGLDSDCEVVDLK